MSAVLSTKLLSEAQKNLILNTGLSLTEYNAIQTKALKLPVSVSEENYQNAIVTSQRTVELIKDFSIKTCFCVGEKTASRLKAFGFNVHVIAQNGQELAQRILIEYPELSFTFFGSAKRRAELSEILEKANIPLSEVFVYDTLKTPKSFNRSFDAVLCFSPSGVDSFFEANASSKAKVVCIGKTTARQAKIYTDRVYISEKTSVESVIVKAVKVLRI